MFRQTAKLAIGVAAISSAGVGFLGVTPSASAFVVKGSSVNDYRVEDITVQDVGQSFIINFDGNVENTPVNGLTSKATFTLKSFIDSEAIFDIELENTSTGSITSSRTSALGFNIDGATVDTVSVAGSLFDDAHINKSLPNGFGKIDVCFINNENNCKGGGGEGNDGGISTGDGASTFTASVQLSPSVESFAMSNFGVRYQSINGDGFSGASGTGRATPYYEAPPAQAIPEPSTVTAVLVSGFALVQQRRRKQTTKNEG